MHLFCSELWAGLESRYFCSGSPTFGLYTVPAWVVKHALALKWPFPVAAWVQHSQALSKIHSNTGHACECRLSLGYLASVSCPHPGCCDSFPCLFCNCMLLNLSSVPKTLNLDVEKDTRDPSVYAEGNQNKITESTASCFAYGPHADPVEKVVVGSDQPW